MFELIPFTNRDKGLWGYLDQMEKSFFQNAFSGSSVLRTDIVDAGDKYLLNAELPGFQREEIQINVDGGILNISAEHKEEQKDEGGSYVRRERRYGSFTRSFDLQGVDENAISAKYENGVLTLELPKQDAQPLPPARQIEIQ